VTETARGDRETPLPIDPFVEEIVQILRRSRAVVVVAAPGAGKTTRLPPALARDGPVVLLQPRRIAARAIASRIAAERGWTLGREVGWQIRFERKFSPDTQLLVVTEGILTARMQADPLLSEFRTVVLDEFHERSIHADVAIALARQAWRARASSAGDDLRLVVMSATIDAAAVSAFLDDCPVIEVPGRLHPLEISYAPEQPIADAVGEALAATDGQVLCFLPGAAEIRRAMADIERRVTSAVEILPLHGSLTSAEQDLVLAPVAKRRVIVATNIAETSLTVPGVTAVVDGGLHKVARYDASRGIDSLETERITADAADQRAGRAGRVRAGIARRLWDSRDRLRPHREPEIHRVDLAATALDVIAWGGDPRTLEWFETPDASSLDLAMALLERLELVAHGRLTAVGEQVRHVPVHPRLARMLVASGGARDVARACALLSERHMLPPRTASTTSDLLSALDDWSSMPSHVQQVARQIADRAGRPMAVRESRLPDATPAGSREDDFRRAILAGYPDRVAMRREPGSDSFLLASGSGAQLARESGVREGELVVALETHSRQSPVISRQSTVTSRQSAVVSRQSRVVSHDALIRLASRIEREWLQPTATETVHRFDAASGRVRAARVDRYGALTLGEHPMAVDAEIAAGLLADAWLARGPLGDHERLVRRLAFAGADVDLGALVRAAALGARSIDDVDPARALPGAVVKALQRDAPETLTMPSGRPARLEYHADGAVSASVKLQELFGLADTPRIGARRVPLRLALLAPNGRPVQVTQDLRSFWERTYPEVRKELRGRYPKHPWPDDPWTATPTARTRRR
jgi:ATP-dependent helicase HrpB